MGGYGRRGDLLDRLSDKFLVGDGCWEWQRGLDGKGYSVFRYEGKNRRGHDVVYEMFRGPVPDGLELDHLCMNKICVRPDHLEPVTHQENMRRAQAVGKGRAAWNEKKTHCPQGHPYDEVNTYRWGGYRYCRTCLSVRTGRLQKAKRALAKGKT